MKHLIHLLTALLILSSCSTQHRATKAIKRIGSKPMLKVLALDYPELFTPTDSIVYVKIHDTITVETKVIEVDTLLINQPCQALTYEDKNLSISYDNGVLNYKIKKTTIKTIYNKSVPVPHTCKPCPAVQIVQDIKNDYIKKSQPKDIQIIYKWWSWFSWLLIVLIVGLFVLKRYIKPV